MTQEQYELLKSFPIDKSYLSHQQLQDSLDPNGDYGSLVNKCTSLCDSGFIEGLISSNGLCLTDFGLERIKEYENQKQRDEETKELTRKILREEFFDYPKVRKNSKDVVTISVLTLLATVILGVLQFVCKRQ